MFEPWPPAFIRIAPPTEPGTPTAHSRPCRPAAAVRRASTGRLSAAPARTWLPSRCRASKPEPSEMARPGKPASATSRFDPRPSTSTGTSATGECPRHREQLLLVVTLGEERRLTPHPVGGQLAERVARSWRGCRGSPRPRAGRRGGSSLAHQLGASINSSGSEVRSPAPRVQHRSPASRRAATRRRSSSRPAA